MTDLTTAQEARVLCRVHEVRGYQTMLREIDERTSFLVVAALREYANKLDRKAVDREAVRERLRKLLWSWATFRAMENDPQQIEIEDRILALMPAANVAAKELEWCETKAPAWLKKKRPNLPRSYIAYTPFGDYDVCYNKDDADWFFQAPSGKQFDGFEIPEAAKAAAQAHYNDAIAKAVRPAHVPAGVGTKKLDWLLCSSKRSAAPGRYAFDGYCAVTNLGIDYGIEGEADTTGYTCGVIGEEPLWQVSTMEEAKAICQADFDARSEAAQGGE